MTTTVRNATARDFYGFAQSCLSEGICCIVYARSLPAGDELAPAVLEQACGLFVQAERWRFLARTARRA